MMATLQWTFTGTLRGVGRYGNISCAREGIPLGKTSRVIGGMAEWLKAPVLKTGLEQSNVGSNPSPSAGKN